MDDDDILSGVHLDVLDHRRLVETDDPPPHIGTEHPVLLRSSREPQEALKRRRQAANLRGWATQAPTDRAREPQ